MPLREELVKTILDALPDCLAVYRFGSWGSGAERPDSDIDLALLPVDPVDSVFRWELAQRLAALAAHDVDLVDLRSASTVLRMQVISSGERLYCRDAAAVEQFEDFVFSSYARLNEERHGILADIAARGSVYGQ